MVRKVLRKISSRFRVFLRPISLGLLICAIATVAGCSSCSRGNAPIQDASGNAAPSTSPELRAKLREAARAKGPTYVARTRHKETDGSPKYTNRLILESSPYLLQHAHNPVEWFSWGDEAFETARRLGRPVLLSVGYSTCHWCHVMEEESFEDEELAAYLNANYVTIKVDREERPDVDAVYMSAVQALTGGGGWPMTVWLTPDRKPFFGGTYFPARDGERGTRLGFLSLLKKFKTSYTDDPASIAGAAADMTKSVQREMAEGSASSVPTAAALDGAASFYRSRFDDANGGMRGAPKFPSSLPVRFLLRDHRRNEAGDSLRMATVTLEHMARGGIHDHVGGGFHRYSTDERWLVPHFEKMLYDNALLARAYLEAYQLTRREDFADTAKDILAYVERDMTSPEGAFYSASDADSQGPSGKREEGWFFTWTPAELVSALGVQNARIVGAYYAVTPAGNFEGRSILSVPALAPEVAKQLTIPAATLAATLETARDTLRRARQLRPQPARDEKILTSWNALMISAYAKAAMVLAVPAHADRAERAADFVLRMLQKDGRLLRSTKDGQQAKNAGYLDDYAFMIAALLDLYEATGRVRWLEEALRLDQILEAHYEDRTGGGFFLTSDDQEKLLARQKPGYDGAEPSGNSVAVLDLLRLHELTTRDSCRQRAERALKGFGGRLEVAPASMSEMLLPLDFLTDVPKEIVIVTPKGRADAEPFLAKLRDVFLPNSVLVVVSEGEALAKLESLVPLVGSKIAKGGKATAYVCEKKTCELPTADPEVFARQLRKKPD